MKKLILTLSWLLISWWVFAYNQTSEELLQEYIFTNCWETEYGYSQKLTYENYKQIWDEICSNSNNDISKEDLKEIFDFAEQIKKEIEGF